MAVSTHPPVDHAEAYCRPSLEDIDIEEACGPQVLLSQEGRSCTTEPVISSSLLGGHVPTPEDS